MTSQKYYIFLCTFFVLNINAKIDNKKYWKIILQNDQPDSYVLQKGDGKSSLYQEVNGELVEIQSKSIEVPVAGEKKSEITIYYKAKDTSSWVVTYNGFKHTFSYNLGENYFLPSRRFHQNQLIYHREIINQTGTMNLKVYIHQNDPQRSSSFIVSPELGDNSEFFFYTSGGGKLSENGIAGISVFNLDNKDNPVPDDLTLQKSTPQFPYNGHFEKIEFFYIEKGNPDNKVGNFVARYTGNLDNSDAVMTFPLYQELINQSSEDIYLKISDGKNNITVEYETSNTTTDFFDYNNAVSLNSLSGINATKSLTYTIVDDNGKNNLDYSPIIINLTKSKGFTLPSSSILTKLDDNSLKLTFIDFNNKPFTKDDGSELEPFIFSYIPSNANKTTVKNNTNQQIYVTSLGLQIAFAPKETREISYKKDSSITVNFPQIGMSETIQNDYDVSKGIVINPDGSNPNIYLLQSSDQKWKIVALDPQSLPAPSSFQNTTGTDSVSIDNQTNQPIVIGVLQDNSSKSVSLFGNFVTAPAGQTVTLKYDKSNLSFNSEIESGFIINAGSIYSLAYLDSTLFNQSSDSGSSITPVVITASEISLSTTDTYTVATDSVNNRLVYQYPKGIYNGANIFILIADKPNPALGTLVGTISSTELATLQSPITNVTIKKTFGDSYYIKNGGFVYRTSSAQATGSSTTSPVITFKNSINDHLSIEPYVNGVLHDLIQPASQGSVYYSLADRGTITLSNKFYKSKNPLNKNYVYVEITTSKETLHGIFILADAQGNPIVEIPDQLDTVLTHLNSANCSSLIAKYLIDADIINLLRDQGLKTDSFNTYTAWVYAIPRAYYYELKKGQLNLNATNLSGSVTLDGNVLPVVIQKKDNNTLVKAFDITSDALQRIKAANLQNNSLANVDTNYAGFYLS